jgi:ABC-type uncharacterized transport system involved in gliding motility auxiliary subunit
VSLLKTYGAAGAVVLLLAAAGLALFAPGRLDTLRSVLLAAGGALLLLAVLLNAGAVRAVLSRRSTRFGTAAAVMILLALGAVVLVNALSVRHNARWDLTEDRRHSLSLQTIKMLETLGPSVEAIAFFRSDTPGKRAAEDLLKQYASHSRGKFTWRMEDPDRAPGLARRYAVESYGTVVLESGAKSERVLDAEEQRLTNGLVKVTRAGKAVAYVLRGHGEHEIGNTDRPGLSQAKEEMEKANYEVRELTLARDPKVPDDAALLLVAGPRTDPFPQELEALDAYIARGGKALVMLAPFQAAGLGKHVAKYGFDVGDDLVIEVNPIGRLFGVGPEVPVVSQYDAHPITRDMGGVMTLFPLTRSVAPAKSPPQGIVLQPLAHTSSQSWGETDQAALARGEAKRDPEDKPGPLPVAVAATIEPRRDAAPTQAKPEGAAERTPAGSRMVVMGSAALASNQFFGAQGNRDFFLNVVSWLAEEEDLIAIRPKASKRAPIILTSAESQLVLWLPVIVLPGAVLLGGVVVVVRRRRAH